MLVLVSWSLVFSVSQAPARIPGCPDLGALASYLPSSQDAEHRKRCRELLQAGWGQGPGIWEPSQHSNNFPTFLLLTCLLPPSAPSLDVTLGEQKQKILRRGGKNIQKNCTKKIFMTKIITIV